MRHTTGIPLVGHREDVAVIHVEPLGVPHVVTRPEQRVRIVLLEPRVEIEIVVLLRPQHSGERLTMDAALVFAERCRRDAIVELVGFLLPLREDRVERRKGWLADAWLSRRRTTREPPAGTSTR